MARWRNPPHAGGDTGGLSIEFGDGVPEVSMAIKRSEFVMKPPAGFVGWDEVRFSRCVSCDQSWAVYPSPFCVECGNG